MKKMCVVLVAAVLLLSGTASVVDADPPSWSSFALADAFLDMYLSPPLATGVLNYSLILGSNPQIVLGGNTYNVDWVQAYFVVSQDQSTGFTATNGSVVTDWTWEAKSLPGQIAGWHGEGTNRVYPGQSKALGFAPGFDITGNAVLSGLHLQYSGPGFMNTGWYKDPLPDVVIPEPVPPLLAGLGGTFLASLTMLRRRLHIR